MLMQVKPFAGSIYLPTPVLVFKQFNLGEVKIAVLYYEEFQICLNAS